MFWQKMEVLEQEQQAMLGNYREFMSEDVHFRGATVGTYTTSTNVVGSGDFNGDGNTDIVSQDSSTGSLVFGL